MKAQKWILAKQFSGVPTDENIKLVEFDLPDELKENGFENLKFLLSQDQHDL